MTTRIPPTRARTMMWFRSDLRVADNTALALACRDDEAEVVALFVLTPDEWRAHDVAPIRIELILRTLSELSERLAELGIPLRIVRSESAAATPKLVVDSAIACGCVRIIANREHELNEQRRDAAVLELARARAIEVSYHTDQVALEPESIRTGEGRFYTVFTPFKKNWTKALIAQGGPIIHPVPRKRRAVAIASDPVPASIEGSASGIDPAVWPGGERIAAKRLRGFVANGLMNYKSTRDIPSIDGTSALSPHLAVGSLSTRQCIGAAMKANTMTDSPLESGSEHALCWIGELCWREFFVHVLVGFPRVCMNRAFQMQTERMRWSGNAVHLDAWKQGRTGVPIVDAGMRQLAAIGWMHNRVRMVAAMFLTKNLFIDWREGERHFMRHLVDGYFASNNGGWQWSASTGTDAAPYFRIFNPVSQGSKFDPDGAYVRKYVPELRGVVGPDVHEPSQLPPLARARLDYPEPIVDLSESRAKAIAAFKALRG